MPATTSSPTYGTVHSRLRRDRGPASAAICADCGAAASEWSYRGGSADELTSPKGKYTPDLSYYVPRCFPCHRALDQQRPAPGYCRRGHNLAEVGQYANRNCRACLKDDARRRYRAKKGITQ